MSTTPLTPEVIAQLPKSKIGTYDTYWSISRYGANAILIDTSNVAVSEEKITVNAASATQAATLAQKAMERKLVNDTKYIANSLKLTKLDVQDPSLGVYEPKPRKHIVVIAVTTGLSCAVLGWFLYRHFIS